MTDKRSSEAGWMYADDALDPSGYTASASKASRLQMLQTAPHTSMPDCLILAWSIAYVINRGCCVWNVV